MNPASFDTWTSIFLIAAFQGCFLSFMIWRQKEENHPGKNLLASLIALFSIMLMFYVSYWTGYSRYLNFYDGLFLTLPFTFGPLIYTYNSKIVEKKSPPLFLLHFLPFFLHIVWVLSVRLFLASYLEREIIFPITNWIMNFQAAHVLFYALMLFFNQNNQDEEHVSMQKFIKYSFLFFALAHAAYYIMVNLGEYVLLFDYIISLSMSVFIYGLAYSGLRFANIQQKKISEPLLTKASVSYYSGLLSDLMEKEKLYLDGDLKLDVLSEKLKLNKHALSQLLNSYFNKNFSDFVNSYRIKEAEKLLASEQYQDLNVVEIAFRVGFNTKASFYNAFRKKNSISPKEYRALINSKSTSLSQIKSKNL